MKKLERLRHAGRPGAVKVKLEMCGDVWFVLMQEISRAEKLTEHFKNLMHVRMSRSRLCSIREISFAIFHAGEDRLEGR